MSNLESKDKVETVFNVKFTHMHNMFSRLEFGI